MFRVRRLQIQYIVGRNRRQYSDKPSIPTKENEPPLEVDAPPINLAKSFSSFETFSIQGMENVLQILEDAESHTSPQRRVSPFYEAVKKLDTRYLNHFTNQFGRQIYTYGILYQFNLKPFLASNPKLVGEIPQTIAQLQEKVVRPQENSYFVRNPELSLANKLNYAQTIARYFMTNDVHCLQRLSIDVLSSMKEHLWYDKSIRNYQFTLQAPRGVPASSRYISHDPMELRSSLGINKVGKNMLVFLPRDKRSLAHVSDMDPAVLAGLVRCDEMEGEVAFEILCKRIFLKIQEVKIGEGSHLLGTKSSAKSYQSEVLAATEAAVREWSRSQIPQATIKKLSPYMRSQRSTSGVERAPEREVSIEYSAINDTLLMDKLLESEQSLADFKVVVAHRSKLASRMMFSPEFRSAVAHGGPASDADDATVKQILISHFDRYFGKFYGIDPVRAEKWLVNVLLAWETVPLVTPALVQDALRTYRQMVLQCELEQSGKKWREYQKPLEGYSEYSQSTLREISSIRQSLK